MSISALRGKRLAITGVDGFVGRHLARIAASSGARVFGLSRSLAIDSELASSLCNYYSTDLRLEWPTDLEVDVVIHLAGRAAVGPSFSDPEGYIRDNSSMVTTMCEALLKRRIPPRVIGVSTGAVYAPPAKDDSILTEESPTSCTSPYVVSKLLIENLFEYYRNRGIATIVVRPFNHIGPNQGKGFLVPDLISRLLQLRSGDPLSTGNLTSARDYTDVRDIARAYLLLAAAPNVPHHLYNIAGGLPTTGISVLQMICESLGREVPDLVVDDNLLRPTDARYIAGSAVRIFNDLGWVPSFSLQQTIKDSINSIS